MCKKVYVIKKIDEDGCRICDVTVCGIFDDLLEAKEYKKELEALKLNYCSYEIEPFFINDKAFIPP